ncbi:MAG: sensor histidine kinase [Streptosporangiaceae bacterium]
MLETLHRWSHTPRRWSLGTLAEATVQADGDRLTLALDALVENAVYHTDADGQIELSARREDESVILAVSDTGPGIPAAEVSRIFGRFARIDWAAAARPAGSALASRW